MTGAVWYAVLLYILGMAVVVYLRPSVMFKPSGVWKEFGLSEGYTVFPFWMFAIVWAILSYALVTLGAVFVSTIVAKTQEVGYSNINMNMNMMNTRPIATPISQAPMNFTQNVTPMGNALGTAATAVGMAAANAAMRIPGYYILENLPEGPKYVYWGPEPPTDRNVIVRQYQP